MPSFGLQNRCNLPKWNRYAPMAWIVEDLKETLPESSQFAGCSTCSLEDLGADPNRRDGEYAATMLGLVSSPP